ncbi:hypothetical protein H8959_019944 [Pygathrix nigripes]
MTYTATLDMLDFLPLPTVGWTICREPDNRERDTGVKGQEKRPCHQSSLASWQLSLLSLHPEGSLPGLSILTTEESASHVALKAQNRVKCVTEGKVLRVTAPGNAAALRQPVAATDSFGATLVAFVTPGTPLKPFPHRRHGRVCGSPEPGRGAPARAGEELATVGTNSWSCSPLATLYSGRGWARPLSSSSAPAQAASRSGAWRGRVGLRDEPARCVARRGVAPVGVAWRNAKRRGAAAREGCGGWVVSRRVEFGRFAGAVSVGPGPQGRAVGS